MNQLVSDYVSYLTRTQAQASRSHFEEARARRALAHAAVSEMRVEQMSGDLIEVGPALEAVRALVMRFRAKVLSVLPRIARESYRSKSEASALERAENLAGEIFDELRQLREEDLKPAQLRVLGRSDGRQDDIE